MIKIYISYIALIALIFQSCSQEEDKSRPNIVWIMAENIGTDLGCYGDPAVKTPNLDKLANEGVLYNQMFTTAPVCSTSRTSMMLGVHQIRFNGHNHRTKRNKELPSPFMPITYYLRKAGYYTAVGCGFAGKTDVNFKIPKDKPVGFDGKDWKSRQEGQPFFAQITLPITHRGNHWYADSPDEITYPEQYAPGAPYYFRSEFTHQVSPDSVVLPPYVPDHPVVRDDWARYLTQIEKMDVQVGDILQRLEDEGIAENTVVIFISDNGADHYRGEYWLYDRGIQVPMIVRWPNKLKTGSKSNDLISSVDISATVLDIAGIDVPEHLDGVPFIGQNAKKREYAYASRDRIDDQVDRIRCIRSNDFKYIRNYMPEKGYQETGWILEHNPALKAIKSLYEKDSLSPAQALHMADVKPEEELYDLKNDRYELNNLAASPNYKKTLEKMRLLLNNWIEETGDKGQFREKKEDAAEEKWFSYDKVYGTDG
ncbi:sulfatase [Reichenbachiella sp. MALMAid0571]|uniref:sulfatase family protein n=1 Tax=Reichenbachiella sp. MALMAid0571 TaxID=3143939 RepID=UPI0032DE5388